MRPSLPDRIAALLVVVVAGCSGGSSPTRSPSGIVDPVRGVAARPDYTGACRPSGLDTSGTCIGVTLAAINAARAMERLKPMLLPSNLTRLSVPEQLLVVIDSERVDRGLAPVAGISSRLSAGAQHAADSAVVPPDPGAGYSAADSEWIGSFANGLDVDYQWMYDDGPGSGLSGCGSHDHQSCWADRHAVLDDFGAGGTVVVGAALSPAADKGGPSLAVTLASSSAAPTDLTYTWDQARQSIGAGTLKPLLAAPTDESASHIRDPAHTVPPDPDFTQVCGSGIDSSAACVGSVLAAVNRARASEGVKPMVLPSGFAGLTIPEQVMVAVNLERVDRGLPPFAGLTVELDRVAQRGADTSDDPPDPGDAYDVSDGEWAGGSANGLDAVYGWMYDDGIGSGNLDCPAKGGPGCWGHRHGILDDFGAVGTLVMGAAVSDRSDTSIAATLAVTSTPPATYVYAWHAVR